MSFRGVEESDPIFRVCDVESGNESVGVREIYMRKQRIRQRLQHRQTVQHTSLSSACIEANACYRKAPCCDKSRPEITCCRAEGVVRRDYLVQSCEISMIMNNQPVIKYRMDIRHLDFLAGISKLPKIYGGFALFPILIKRVNDWKVVWVVCIITNPVREGGIYISQNNANVYILCMKTIVQINRKTSQT